jgi:hypothetical protein
MLLTVHGLSQFGIRNVARLLSKQVLVDFRSMLARNVMLTGFTRASPDVGILCSANGVDAFSVGRIANEEDQAVGSDVECHNLDVLSIGFRKQ